MNECKKEKRGEGINFFNVDNIEFMKATSDNYYDLAIVDPPYGIGYIKNEKNGKIGRRKTKNSEWGKFAKQWDFEIPPKEYFNELFRISKNQIIWGGNYFTNFLPPKMCWIVWDKLNGHTNFSDCELAWTSFDTAVRKIELMWQPFGRIHPTQKPIELYRIVLNMYAENGMKIIDTHGGSGSIAIACDIEKFDLDICEIDKEYFCKSKKRFDDHKRQLKLF